MNHDEFDHDDDIAQLVLSESEAYSDEFRDSVFARTSAAIRRRGTRRRLIVFTAPVLAYGLGIVTMLALPAVQPTPDVLTKTEEAVAIPEAKVLSAEDLRDPERLPRMLAGATEEDRRALLLRAGDLYLEELGNVELAVRCYGRWFDLAPDSQQLTIQPSDTWLLSALKRARTEERSNA